MLLYTLEAEVPLTKEFTKTDSGYKTKAYPLIKNFSSDSKNVESIDDFYDFLTSTAAHPARCIVKGTLNRRLDGESRAGATDASEPTQWLCLDFDYVDIVCEDDLEDILLQMGLGGVSYVMQYGASHKITKPFSAHLYFLLDGPVNPAQLKTWLMLQNFKIPVLEECLSLAKTDCALIWPLDITLGQNDRLIYTAPPICKGFVDPVGERIKRCYRDKDRLALAKTIRALTPSQVEAKKSRKINDLRKAKGVPSRRFTTKTIGDIEILVKPDKVIVTGVKNERGFTYLNLNGGDSWGYYFPQENPEFVYNFKGEPNYKLAELAPDFYRDYRKALVTSQSQEGEDRVPFAFLDRRTDKYYRGVYYTGTDQLEIYPTDSLKKLTDFAKQTGMALPEFIEEWDYEFRFDEDKVFAPKERFMNRYRRTPFLQRSIGDEAVPTNIPPTIHKVLLSVVGSDHEVLEHFLNWLACVVQYRQRTQTAWVFNGREGTGKGVMFNYILSPLIGPEYCRTTRLSTLEGEYNGFMEDCVFLMIDESKVSQLRNHEKVMALLKNVIVEPRIQIRRMRTDPFMATNYVNVIVTSNHPDAIYISPTDRRFNVGVYQHQKLWLDDADIQRIQDELWDFAKILRTMEADEAKARTPLQNEARTRMMYLTETSVTVAANALLDGDLDFFIDQLPTDQHHQRNAHQIADQINLDAYVQILAEAEHCAIAGEPQRLTRDQAKIMLDYVIGETPRTPNKFTNFMKHYGVFFDRKRKDGRIIRGLDVAWRKPEFALRNYLEAGGLKLKVIK